MASKTVINTTAVKRVDINGTGPQGPQGTPGTNATATTVIAAVPLGGFRAVIDDGNYADGTNMDRYIGVTKSAVAAGLAVEVQKDGPLTDPSFSFTPGQPVFASASGVLSQTPSSVNIRRIGWASTATTINLDPYPNIGLC